MGVVIKATVWVLFKQMYGCYYSKCMGATVLLLSKCMGVIKANVWVLLKQMYGCY